MARCMDTRASVDVTALVTKAAVVAVVGAMETGTVSS